MNKSLLILAFSFFTFCLIGQQKTLIYSKIKIDLTTTPIAEVAALGLEADHGHHAHGKHLTNFYSQVELDLLDNAGIDYEILIDDAQAFYRQHGTMDENANSSDNRNLECTRVQIIDKYQYTTPANYKFGTMGGYLTYSEVLKNLDLMSELYPDLITDRLSIGEFKTHQGRSLYYLVISNTPNNIDTTKPQILFDAMHHAREPNGVSQLLFYMWYLLENYGTDDEVTFLVDNTSQFFFPIINPDGYVYNEQTNPNGGGLWRKNRYPNAAGDTVGVDLNRNYGHFWAHDNVGSSSFEGSQTYRGPAPFSEPETQAVRKLCTDNNFQIGLNYHTYGNLLVHPWGYEDGPTEDDALFKALGSVMATENDFLVGTGRETLGYTTNGDADDWMYGEQDEKNKMYSMTPEVGPQFWPSSAEIDQLNKSAMRHNLNAAHLLHSYGWLQEKFVSNTLLENGVLFYEFEKSGLKEGLVDIQFVSETPGFILLNNSLSGLDLKTGDKLDISIGYEMEEGFDETEINFTAVIDYGTFTQEFPYTKTYAGLESMPSSVDLDSLNNLANFSAERNWGLTESDYFSAPSSITDSPDGNYENNFRSHLFFDKTFSTVNAEKAYVKFQTRYDIELAYDHVQFQISVDGAPYVGLCGELTSNSANQFSDTQPVYQGIQSWSQETIDLEDYLGQDNLLFRFVFGSDQSQTGEGFYFDDFTFEFFEDNTSATIETDIPIISVRPNPTSDQITIQFTRTDFNKNIKYTIHNLNGQLVSKGQIEKPIQAIDLSSIETGNYTLSVFDKEVMISRSQFVKI